MGAGQSSTRGSASAGQEVKTSYYELLGVQRHATEDEIKKGYRRKALELHPDRNYGNEQAATQTFAEVQTAYEVLSDVQERAWYDSHESAILRGDDVGDEDGVPTYQDVRITTADDLTRMVRKFNSAVEFSDAPSGFFGFVRDTFAQLAKEEEIAATWENTDVREYPSFGHKDDAYDDVVKLFYSAWSSFSTVKSFAWKDKYRLSEAADRWSRRRMEQENKKFRQDGVREFNDAVRSLVAFIRKRDPRYIPSTQTEEQRQQTLRDAAKAQAARARAANEAKLNTEVPEWTKVREPEELEESEEEDVEVHIFECVACNKEFKSEKQWEAHEKSKKHQKAVYALQKKMRKENAHLNLNGSAGESGTVTPTKAVDEDALSDAAPEMEIHEAHIDASPADASRPGESDSEEVSSEKGEVRGVLPDSLADGPANKVNPDSPSDSEDSDYASPETVQARLQSTALEDTPPTTGADSEDVEDVQSTRPRMGKAAQKRAKKAAAAAANQEPNGSHKCATCEASFPSKTRLFQHIKDHGHAAPKTVFPGGGGKISKSKSKQKVG